MKTLQFFLSAFVLIGSIYAWGKVRTSVAKKHMKKGLWYLEKGNQLEAIHEFQEATTDLERDPQIWYYLSLALCQAGARDDAQKTLAKALQLKTDYKAALHLEKQLESGD